jgi:hypothetical protein
LGLHQPMNQITSLFVSGALAQMTSTVGRALRTNAFARALVRRAHPT